MSTFGSLYVGTSGLQTGQNALNTTAHNLANVGTTGYTRQQVYQAELEFNTVGSSSVSMMQAGIGVSYAQARQVRDYFLDKYYRTENGRQAFYETAFAATSEISTLFGEMEGVAFQNSISELYTSFEEFDKIPDDTNNQDLVILKANSFLERAKEVFEGLKQYQIDVNEKVTTSVTRINEIGKEIITLNRQILTVESGGVEHANDLRDARNALLDELSGYGKIDVKEGATGLVSVSFEDNEFVKETQLYKMDTYLDTATNFMIPIWSNQSDYTNERYQEVFNFNVAISSEKNTDIGSLKAYVLSRGDHVANYTDIEGIAQDVYNKSLSSISSVMSAQSQLDQLIHNMVTSINDILSPLTTITDDNGVTYQVWDAEHAVLGSDGKGPGEELFSRNSVSRYEKKTLTVNSQTTEYYVYNAENANDKSTLYTLENLKINTKLLEDESKLPHLGLNGAVDYEMTDKLVKVFSNSFITLNPNSTTKLTIEEYYENMTDLFATRGSSFQNKALTVASTAETVFNKRQEIVGVSSDEELSNMIKYQNAYNASTRYINVISEMIEHLITQLG